jgi:HEAT repeat protein
MPRLFVTTMAAFVSAASLLTPVSAQTPQTAASAAEAAQLASGWTALAQGDAARAASIGDTLLGTNPRNRGALALVIDAEIARGGAAAALNAYERWLGGKRLDDGYALRAVSTALLKETVRNTAPAAAAARREAFEALAEDGETDVLLAAARNSSGPFENQLLARMGNEAAIRTLIGQLKSPDAYRPQVIEALAGSHSPLAVQPLTDLLQDPDIITRASAADALGTLGIPSAAASLQPLLNDRMYPVKFAAAQALLRLKDTSGLAFLRQEETNPVASVRVMALKATSVIADSSWASSVEPLLHDPDPLVRLKAAELAAPYYLEEVKQVLDPLLIDPNPAIREEASRIYARLVATDFKTLRGMLRSADALSRVRGAARILSLTR